VLVTLIGYGAVAIITVSRDGKAMVSGVRGAIKLTKEDKQELPPDHLFMLALRGVAHLTPEDKHRLTPDDLMHLQMRGVV